MAELEVHATADILQLEHGAAPGGSSDGDLNRMRTKLGVAGDQSVAAAEKNSGVDMVHRFDFEHGGGREIVKKNSTFDFGLNDGAIYIISQVWVRDEHTEQNVVRSVLQIRAKCEAGLENFGAWAFAQRMRPGTAQRLGNRGYRAFGTYEDGSAGRVSSDRVELDSGLFRRADASGI